MSEELKPCPLVMEVEMILTPSDKKEIRNLRAYKRALVHYKIKEQRDQFAAIAAVFLEGVDEEWAKTDICQAALADWVKLNGPAIVNAKK
jgi:hypothetical protein